jgi:hypothetical protein
VVQITAEVAEGIADTAPIIWAELLGGRSHGLILPRALLSDGTLKGFEQVMDLKLALEDLLSVPWTW